MTHVIPALGGEGGPGGKSCATCKWRRADVATNPDVCSVIGNKPVSLSIVTREQALAQQAMIGGSCPVYNAPHPDKKYQSGAVPVGFPLREIDPKTIRDYQRIPVQSCTDCENYAPPAEVAKLGFGGRRGMCVAKGELIETGSARTIASACDLRRKGPQITSVELNMMNFFPVYTLTKIEAWMAENDRKRSGLCLPDNFDPLSHVGRLAGIPDQGIRTWVKVMDPEGTGNSVDLPIFDRAYFEAYDAEHGTTETSKIPNNWDEERPDLYVDHAGMLYRTAVAFMKLDETPALWGPPGVGKTEFARYFAWVMQIPFERVSITGTTELDDLQGSMRFEASETKFHLGRVSRAWAKPNVLLIDEPNVGPREVWQFLRPLTDNSKQLVLDADRGQRIKRDDNCFLMFAMNPAWDIRNDGANTLADADIRRLFHLELGLPSAEIERKIIRDHCMLDEFNIPDALLDLVMSVAVGIRALSADSLPITWGIGTQIKVARYLNWFDPLVAYKQAAADSLEPDVRDLILNEVRTKFGVRS